MTTVMVDSDTKFVVKRKDEMVIIPRSLLDDNKLSPLAKLLMIQIIAHPEVEFADGIDEGFMMHAIGEGGRAFENALQSLIDRGHLVRE